MELLVSTPKYWVETAVADFDHFLIDHAACERKASAVGMSFVVRYPDRTALLDPMIQFAREELEHFHQVYRLIAKRGLTIPNDEEDPYVNLLLKHVRSGREDRFLDRLLMSSLIEARGCERIMLVADYLQDPELKHFYARLGRAEGHHKNLFVDLARFFFPDSVVNKRMDFLLQVEADAITQVPFRSALH